MNRVQFFPPGCKEKVILNCSVIPTYLTRESNNDAFSSAHLLIESEGGLYSASSAVRNWHFKDHFN